MGLFFIGTLTNGCVLKKPPVPQVLLNQETAQMMKKEKGFWIEVQIPQRKLILAKSDRIIKAFPIAVGMPSHPTPVGRRKIDRVIWNPWWYPPKGSDWVEKGAKPVRPRTAGNPLGEIKMPIGRAYLIHGTKKVSSIGRWASHGCIRMVFEDIFGMTQILMTEYSKVSAIDSMEKANKNPHREFSDKLEYDIPVVLNYDLVKINDDYAFISPDVYRRYGKKLPQHIAQVVKPYLKKKQAPNIKKIKNLLKDFKGQTFMIPLENLAKNGEK